MLRFCTCHNGDSIVMTEYQERVDEWAYNVCEFLDGNTHLHPTPWILDTIDEDIVVCVETLPTKVKIYLYRIAKNAQEVIQLPLDTCYFTRGPNGRFRFNQYGGDEKRSFRGALTGPILTLVSNPMSAEEIACLTPPKD